MDNKTIIDNAIEDIEFNQPGIERFRVDDDFKAEWAIVKIKEEQADAQRIMDICKNMILHYQEQLKGAEEELEKKTSYLKGQLEQYFEGVDKKKTKTQESYKLASGTLKRKYPKPKITRDNDTLIKWLKARDMYDYIKQVESAEWGELKKKLKETSNGYVTEDGEIVEGVKLEARDPEFTIEV